MNELKDINLDNILTSIRFLFNVFVLGFISIIITGKLITQIPICKMEKLKGKQFIKFDIKIVRFDADGEEAVMGFASFLFILLIVGVTIGLSIQKYFNDHFGTDITQFEAICLFSAFCGVAIAFILKIIYSSIGSKNLSFDSAYNETIEKLSKKN